MHVVLPADGGVRAEITEDLVVRLGRELSLSNAIDNAKQPGACTLERFFGIRVARFHDRRGRKYNIAGRDVKR